MLKFQLIISFIAVPGSTFCFVIVTYLLLQRGVSAPHQKLSSSFSKSGVVLLPNGWDIGSEMNANMRPTLFSALRFVKMKTHVCTWPEQRESRIVRFNNRKWRSLFPSSIGLKKRVRWVTPYEARACEDTAADDGRFAVSYTGQHFVAYRRRVWLQLRPTKCERRSLYLHYPLFWPYYVFAL